MAADLSVFAFLAPVWVFLAVFIIIYALLAKTDVLGGEWWLNLFISFVIATIFVSAGSIQQYISTIIPWMAILIISIFFILLLIGFIGKEMTWMHKGIGIVVVIISIVIFVVSGIKVFYHSFAPYIPGSYSYAAGVDPDALFISDWFFSGPIFGALILIILSAIVSWVLVKTK